MPTKPPVFDLSKAGERYAESGPTAEAIYLSHNARRYTPNSKEGEDDGTTSRLTDSSMGDWSWKPARDARLGDKFVTYKPTMHPLDGIRFNTENPINAN